MVPAFDLAFAGRNDVYLDAGLFQRLLGAGQFGLFKTIGHEDGDTFVVKRHGKISSS
ncbi:hypothetical protein D3C76_1548520 [compost metagenome]